MCTKKSIKHSNFEVIVLVKGIGTKMNYVEDLREIVGHRPLILVGAVTVIADNNNRILLQKRKTTSYGMWGLPGGLMELGESTEDTARREVYEETGLTIGKLHLIDILSGPDNYIKIPNGDEFYAVTVAYYTYDTEGELLIDESESLELKYLDLDDLPENMVKSHRTIINKFLETDKEKFL